MKRATICLLLPFFASAVLTGCIEELPAISKVEDTRILGVRIDVPDDPGRAWVVPGETAEVSLLVVNPDLSHTSDETKMMLLGCTPLPVGIGPPLCLELLQLTESFGAAGGEVTGPGAIEPLDRISCSQIEQAGAELSGLLSLLGMELGCVVGEPRFELTVPAEATAAERLVRGVLCDRGEPFLDPSSQALFGCDLQQGGEEIPFAMTVPIQTGEQSNRHPSLAGASIAVDGVEWPVATGEQLLGYQIAGVQGEQSFDCRAAADDGLILLVAKGTRTLRVEVSFADFEAFEEDGEQLREELRFAVYSTEGKLERDRSVVRAQDDPLAFDLQWETPGEVGEAGMLARFFFAVRDQRGGFDSTERTLCVTQSPEE